MTANDDYIVEILRDAGLIDQAQGAAALEDARKNNRDVIDVLSDDEKLPKPDLLKALAHQFGMETISLTGIDITPDITGLVPADVATRYRIIPVQKTEGGVMIAIGDPLDIETIDTLRYVLKQHVEAVVAMPEEIKAAIKRYYPETDVSVQSMLEQMGEAESHIFDDDDLLTVDGDAADSEEPIIKLVNLLILEGFRSRASDIHLEPLNKKFRVRYRIDGVLKEVEGPPRRLHPSVISRIKIMSKMKISEKRLCQDGRIEIKVMGRDLDLRVSAIPTNHGESIVMRILDKEGLMLGLPSLGFFSDDQQTFERMIKLPDGVLLITGPTGSGKTTTLYACLNYINQPNRKIITVEDPVEYQMSGINQVHVRADIGLTFAAALRSILRQAPNIIMIGEIRDLETAEIAVNAALTGHLVFSTLHTNDAPSAVTRMIDIGVKPFLVSSSVRAIMGQRLVRNICEQCKTEYQPTDAELRMLGPASQQIANAPLYRGVGCPNCNRTGYKGRKGIFEVFVINDEVRQLIYSGLSSSQLRIRARELGMRTLREDGLRKVMSGMTTLEEVFRVTMRDES
ncbi:MAG: Flp pilus assembly complex ATPase component TadA [Kiritimatiellales bacterium]|nr:Flp pilus assembly complex ATPase component TadA [Kiritimatiellales bacterium]